MKLIDGSKIAVIGGGPAGSFFTHFILQTPNRLYQLLFHHQNLL